MSSLVSVPLPPVAPRRPHPLAIHGEERSDEYFWIRNREDPAVEQYLQAENNYAEAVLAPTRALQETLYQEMLGRIQQTDVSVPYREGDYWYYLRTQEGLQYPRYCRKPDSPDAEEQVLLDLNQLAEGHPFLGLGALRISDDGRFMAFSTDTTGYREYTLVVRDLSSGALVAGPIEKSGSVAWAADNRTLFYAVEDSAKRFYQVWRHELGGESTLIHEEPDERFRLHVERTRSRRYVLLQSDSHTTSELWSLSATAPRTPARSLVPRIQDRELEIDDLGDSWLLRVNDTGPNFRVVRIPEEGAAPAEWTELLPHRPDVMLEGIDAFAGFWVAWERVAGLGRIRVTRRDTGSVQYVEFPEPVYEVGPGANAEWESSALRYEYESPITPPSVYDYAVTTGASTLLKRREIPGGFDPSRYRCERRTVAARDGTPIPVSLMYRQAPPVARPAPLLLTGYGAYGLSFPVGFSSNRLSLLDRGVLIGIAHVRGGGELGKPWHDAGRMAHKRNSFHDFLAVADALVDEGMTTPSQLAIEGGSAGGLLVTAVTNLRPERFGIVIAQVPFVDVLNTMLDPSLPLTVGEYEEWGNPALPEQYAWLREYCPYTNLEPREYPAMLVRTSLNDSQVMFWEPAKYVARMRALKRDGKPVLLLTNMGAGHGGASGRYDRLREIALDYAFLLWRLGIWEPG